MKSYKKNHETLVKLLIKYDADPNAKDIDGWMLLWKVIKTNHEILIKLLIEINVEVDLKNINN